jgi:hypothetical protein
MGCSAGGNAGTFPGQKCHDPRHARQKHRGVTIVPGLPLPPQRGREQAGAGIAVRPRTDGALAVAVMHVLFEEGLRRDGPYYMRRYTYAPETELAAHVATRTPEWASGSHRA